MGLRSSDEPSVPFDQEPIIYCPAKGCGRALRQTRIGGDELLCRECGTKYTIVLHGGEGKR